MITPTQATCEDCGHRDEPNAFETWFAEGYVGDAGGGDASRMNAKLRVTAYLHCPNCSAQVGEATARVPCIPLSLRWESVQ